jgi:cytochrome c
MRFTKLLLGLTVMAAMLVVGSLFADERGTPDEAKALVEKAAAHLTAVGAEKAFADFNNPTGGYVDRDLFVFVYSLDGKIVSAGANTALLGRMPRRSRTSTARSSAR